MFDNEIIHLWRKIFIITLETSSSILQYFSIFTSLYMHAVCKYTYTKQISQIFTFIIQIPRKISTSLKWQHFFSNKVACNCIFMYFFVVILHRHYYEHPHKMFDIKKKYCIKSVSIFQWNFIIVFLYIFMHTYFLTILDIKNQMGFEKIKSPP